MEGEQHRQAGPVAAAGMEQPRQEVTGLVILAHAEERADTDACVPGPGKAVVPVADAARVFGKRGGGRRHRRTRRGVGEQPKGEQAAHHGVAVGNVVGDVGAPAAPAPLVVAHGGPRSRRVDIDQRLVIGDTDDDGQVLAGLDGHRVGPTRFEVEVRRAGQRHSFGTPRAHGDVAAPLDTWCDMAFAEAGIELDADLDRALDSAEAPYEQRGRQEPSGDLAHHGFGKRQPAGVGYPRGAERRGLVPVLAVNHGGGGVRTHAKPTGGDAADEPTEHGRTVETRDAHPVDRAVRADQRRRSGVTDHPQVLDRPARPAHGLVDGVHVRWRATGRRARCHRGCGRRSPPPGSGPRS